MSTTDAPATYRTPAAVDRWVIRIVEHDDFWRIHWTAADHEDSATAAEALTSVKTMGMILAGHISSILMVEWEPSTRVGRICVEALQ